MYWCAVSHIMVTSKMDRWLSDVSKASSLCPLGKKQSGDALLTSPCRVAVTREFAWTTATFSDS
jgi:hypothetical protein